MTPRPPPRGRVRWGRLLVVGLFIAAAVLAFLYLQCFGGWGVGGKGKGEGEGKGSARPALTVRDAGVPRCQLRVDSQGISVNGSAGDVAAALAACKKAGAADVVVTGAARQGQWDALKSALEGAGVQSFVHGSTP